tara:strand:+ start:499 stop:699 length:201 start_codon:yes stop_codon:yes gene_type:complete
MKFIPYSFLILFILFNACSAPSRYEVHLIEGGGYHHLITADTKTEALDFVDNHEDSHGVMKIIKVK